MRCAETGVNCVHRRKWLLVAVLVTVASASVDGIAVAAPPANDKFANAQLITGAAGDVGGTNAGATIELGEPVLNTNGNSIWYRWIAPKNGAVRFAVLVERRFNPSLNLFAGSSIEQLQALNATQESMGYRAFQAEAGTEYRLAIASFPAEAGPFLLTWGYDSPPLNDDFTDARQISGPSGYALGNHLDATCEDDEPSVEYPCTSSVWWRWTAPASGCVTFEADFALPTIAVFTGLTLDGLMRVPTTTNGGLSAGGVFSVTFSATAGVTYYIRVDTGVGSSQSPISLIWEYAGTGPANDNFGNAEPIVGLRGHAAGSTLNATDECGEPYIPAEADIAYSGRSIWYMWVAPEDRRMTFATDRSDFDTVMAIYRGDSLAGLDRVATSDDWLGDSTYSLVYFDAVAGETYRISVAGYARTSGVVALNWGPYPPNDYFAAAEAIRGAAGRIEGTTRGATREDGEPPTAGSTAPSVWYSWQSPESGRVAFDTIGSDFAALVAVFSGESINGLVSVAGAQTADGHRIIFTATAGSSYRIAVASGGGYRKEIGNLVLNWVSAAAPENDDAAQAGLISGLSGTLRADNAVATIEPAEADAAGTSIYGSLWYSWQAPLDGYVTFEVNAQTFVPYLDVHLENGARVADCFPSQPGICPVTFLASAGTRYPIRVASTSAAAGEIVLSWSLVPFTPTPTMTPTPTATDTPTPTPSTTRTKSSTPSHTLTPTASTTAAKTLTPTVTATPSVTQTTTRQTPTPTPTPIPCIGDCSDDTQVTIDELLTMVNIALGSADIGTCSAGDANHDKQITIDEVLRAVNNALSECGV